MSNYPLMQQPESRDSIFTLMPNEYIRFEYTYKLGCCCFSSRITTVTNMRLITHIIKTPTIFSRKTSTGKEKIKVIYLANMSNNKQIQSATSSSRNKWWIKCSDVLSCTCSNQDIEWLDLSYDMQNLAMETTNSTVETNNIRKASLVERF
ncbi:unnamed protein product [Rotaria sp. Silwood2]|nr:unnamed protein product [Rotaria sp. Silwood2]CAF2626109.1 unnamed protein product [Rotaria sp. Silwood2]CAF2847130.1 unnamed protein product [Rotaria sp. Silwood2]CAF3019145.1 unnamed protein product [Rotaria sp. Silwood2]CAF3854518.1 unnamed protein product [Rotaria sp. Silwood2]